MGSPASAWLSALVFVFLGCAPEAGWICAADADCGEGAICLEEQCTSLCDVPCTLERQCATRICTASTEERCGFDAEAGEPGWAITEGCDDGDAQTYCDRCDEAGTCAGTVCEGCELTWAFPYMDALSDGAAGCTQDMILVARTLSCRAPVRAILGSATELESTDAIDAEVMRFLRPSGVASGGPVVVSSTAPIYASRRTICGGVLDEVLGIPGSALASEYYFPWIDALEWGGTALADGLPAAWVAIGNTSDGEVLASVSEVTDADPDFSDVAAHATGAFAPPVVTNGSGPWKVWTDPPAQLVVSTRVRFPGGFNETLGIAPSRLATRVYLPAWWRAEPQQRWIVAGGASGWVQHSSPVAEQPFFVEGPEPIFATARTLSCAIPSPPSNCWFDEVPGVPESAMTALGEGPFAYYFPMTGVPNSGCLCWLGLTNPLDGVAQVLLSTGDAREVLAGEAMAISLDNDPGPLVVVSTAPLVVAQGIACEGHVNETIAYGPVTHAGLGR